jgi:Sulfotransferase family
MSGGGATTNAPAATATTGGQGAAPGHPALRAPDFFIVGQPKSGTTALYEMLRLHPQIHMPASKEPWYLADELLERTPPRPEGTPRSDEEYLSWFAGAAPEQRIGEASALYLWSRTAAARIARLQPQARIVAILREPASLLRSLHMQFLRTYVETESDFAAAISLEPARREGRELPRHTYWPKALLYSDHVRYVEQLRRYHELFGRERVLVLIYDDFLEDNEATVRAVLRFLEVDDGARVETLQANPTLEVRSQRLHELVHAVSVGHGPASRALKSAIKALTPAAARRRALLAAQRRVVYREPAAPDERFMQELRARFKGEVEALGEYLDLDLLARWGYDGVE